MGLAAPVVAPVAGFPFIEPVDLGTGWQMNGLTSGYVRISPPAVSPSVDYTFPVVAPTVGQILSAAAPVAGVSVLSWTTVASTPPAGSGTEIQIRNGSAFGALTGSSFAGGVATLPTLAVTDLTSGRIPFASTLGRLVDSAALAWNNGTGTLSATNVSGSLTGNVAGNLTGNVTGLVNTVNITTGGSASAFLNGAGSYAVVAYSGLSGIPSTFAPSAHASSHMSAGADAIRLDELKAPMDVTTLDVSITTHGLTPKLPNDATKFLNGVGAYAVPAGVSIPGSGSELLRRASASTVEVVTSSGVSGGNITLTQTGTTTPPLTINGNDSNSVPLFRVNFGNTPGSMAIAVTSVGGMVGGTFHINEAGKMGLGVDPAAIMADFQLWRNVNSGATVVVQNTNAGSSTYVAISLKTHDARSLFFGKFNTSWPGGDARYVAGGSFVEGQGSGLTLSSVDTDSSVIRFVVGSAPFEHLSIGLNLITVAEAVNIAFGGTTGTKFGTATTQKMGWWNAAPVVRPTAVADATGGATVDAEARTAINALLSRMRTIGLIAA